MFGPSGTTEPISGSLGVVSGTALVIFGSFYGLPTNSLFSEPFGASEDPF